MSNDETAEAKPQSKPEKKPDYITVYESISGWNSVRMWWNPELGGFWEPYSTGLGPFETEEAAVIDGRLWAVNEKLEFFERSQGPA